MARGAETLRGRRFGPYVVLAPLGSGAMGQVYRALHQGEGTEVALKTILPRRRELAEVIRHEIRLLARLDHPGVVRILAEGVEGGIPWYAMPLASGEDLMTWCRRIWAPNRMPPEQRRISSAQLRDIIAMFSRLCEILSYVHGEGLVHRDLKPANVLVSPRGEPLLVDFGLAAAFQARSAAEALQLTGAVGTLLYAAPEQLRGEEVDARADMYALGCMLFEALTARPPFMAQVPDELVAAHLSQPVPRLDAYVRGVPEELEVLLQRCVAKSPRHRLGYMDILDRRLLALQAALGPVRRQPASSSAPYLYRPAFTGRGPILDDLLALLDGGEHRAALLRGPGGIGKTRLLLELARRAHAGGHQVILSSCGVSGGPSVAEPLSALRPLLLVLADRMAECRRDIPLWALSLLASFEPAVAAAAEVDVRDAAVGTTSPEVARSRLFEALDAALGALAAAHPLLLLFDDVDQADKLAAGYFGARRAADFGDLPVALVATAGSDTPDVTFFEAPTLAVGPLSEGEIYALLADMLALEELPPAFAQVVVEAAEGNPFYAAEYARAAVAAGFLQRDREGRWRWEGAPGDVVDLGVPTGIEASIQLHLSQVSRRARDLMDWIALVGDESSVDLLHRLYGSDRGFDRALHELKRTHLVETTVAGRVRCTQRRLRDVVVRSMETGLRRRRHCRIAEVLEEVTADWPEEHRPYARIGLHWEIGGRLDPARDAFLAAARRARRGLSHEEALSWYERALAFPFHEAQDRAAVLIEVARRLLVVLGRQREALGWYLEARELAQRAGDARLVAQTYLGEAAIKARLGELQAALDLAQRGLDLCGPSDGEVAGELHTLRAGVHWTAGDLEAATAEHREALVLYRRAGNRRGEGKALSNLALVELDRGAYVKARHLLERSLEIGRELGDLRYQTLGLGNLARVLAFEGRHDEARRLHARIDQSLRRLGDDRFRGLFAVDRARLERLAGSKASVIAHWLHKADDLLARADDPLFRALCSCEHVHLSLLCLDPAAAQRHLERARAWVAQSDMPLRPQGPVARALAEATSTVASFTLD